MRWSTRDDVIFKKYVILNNTDITPFLVLARVQLNVKEELA